MQGMKESNKKYKKVLTIENTHGILLNVADEQHTQQYGKQKSFS
ncbi:hypothetical protein SFC70_20515 [Bacillus subtilis]